MTTKHIEKLIKEDSLYFVRQNGSHKINEPIDISGLVVVLFMAKNAVEKGTLNLILKKKDH